MSAGDDGPLRLPVQYVIHPDQDFRGYAGRIAGGGVAAGDAVKILPSGHEVKVSRIYVGNAEQARASVDQSVTVTLQGEFDVSRGDMIVEAGKPAEIADQVSHRHLDGPTQNAAGTRLYHEDTEGRSVTATLAKPRYQINVNNYEQQPADTLALNDIASCNISLDRAIAFDGFLEANRTTGSFILIDPETNATAGVGMIKFALRRSQNIHWQALDIDKAQAMAKGQKPRCAMVHRPVRIRQIDYCKHCREETSRHGAAHNAA